MELVNQYKVGTRDGTGEKPGEWRADVLAITWAGQPIVTGELGERAADEPVLR
jgi:hypothetical protein